MNTKVFAYAWRGFAIAGLYLGLSELADIFLWEQDAKIEGQEVLLALVIGFFVVFSNWVVSRENAQK